MTPGEKIIEGLLDAQKGNLVRVTIGGVTWVRHDAGSPEAALAEARSRVAELTTECDRLRSLLQEAGEVMACLDPLIEGNAGTSILVAWFRVEQARPVLARIKAEIREPRQEQPL